MIDSRLLGRVTVIEVKDNNDGTCTLNLEIPDDLKENLKQSLGWKRWSSKKFNQFFLEALTKHAKDMEGESRITATTSEHLVDVFDNKSVQSSN